MLKLTDIEVKYGHVLALKRISMYIPKGSIVSLLGANGSGKSTILKTISRLVNPKSGNYLLSGETMLKKSSDQIVKSGIIHCPENRRIFPLLTVEENLRIGGYHRNKKEISKGLERVFSYFPRLAERLEQNAGTLSGGEQQMLAIGRSLIGQPQILLLDEPSLGIAPNLVKEIFDIIYQINQDGTSILLVEQNAYLALEISDYTYVLENGLIALEGESNKLKETDQIRQLYLGGEE